MLESQIIDENWVPTDPEIITGTQFQADADIFSAHRLRQNHKSLTKTESHPTQKSSPEPISSADAKILIAYRLRENHKSLTKIESQPTQKSSPEHSSRLT